MKIKKAEFIAGAADPESIPPGALPEIAFAGRSNVGKSSLINKLVGRKKLAVTSSSPGRTRQINFFNINDGFMFVDLPGYGYAKVSRSERRKWGTLISEYMRGRDTLRAVVMILDIRRDPGEQELSLLDMLEDLGIPPVIVLTKSDKIKRGQRKARAAGIAETLGAKPDELVIFSSATGEGKEQLWKILKRRLDSGAGA